MVITKSLSFHLLPLQSQVVRRTGLFLVMMFFMGLLMSERVLAGNFNEISIGDFSNAPSSPTPIFFTESGNRVSGVVGGPDLVDYWSFQIRPGQALEAIFLSDLITEEPGGRTDSIFFYIDDAASTTPTLNENALGWLGGWHLTDRIAPSFDSILELTPVTGQPTVGRLGPGFYTIGVQQNGPYDSNYSFTFDISGTAVPEPNAATLLLGALTLLCTRRTRRD